MEKKISLVVVFMLMSMYGGMAQRSLLPEWIISKPIPENDTYLYQMEWGSGQDEREARKEAFARMFQFAALQVGQPIDSEEINRAVQSGTDYSVISAQYKIPINKVCEYFEETDNGWRVYILCQVARTGNASVQWTPFSCPSDNINKLYAKEALYVDDWNVYRNGERLSDVELRSIFANSKSYELYNKGMRKGRTAWGVTAAGGIILMGSQFFWFGYYPDYGWKKDAYKYCVIVGSALGLTMVLIPVFTYVISNAVGKAQIRKAVDLYNNGRMYSQSEMNLKFGVTGNGVCMSLSF